MSEVKNVSPETLARRRADETGMPYLVTMDGRVREYTPENASNADVYEGGVFAVFHPKNKSVFNNIS